MATSDLDGFLQPLAIDDETVLELSRELASTFRKLSAESLDQFLPTPISESVLRPAHRGQGRQVWLRPRSAHTKTDWPVAVSSPSTCKVTDDWRLLGGPPFRARLLTSLAAVRTCESASLNC
jgi:hypothetical protein